jgi:hypothetical protein
MPCGFRSARSSPPSPPSADGKTNAAVYLYRKGKAWMTRIRVGHNDGKETEVLSGLTAEDRVIVNPKGLLPGDGIPVEAEESPVPK